MLVLGIETSCDETGLALYDSEKGLLAEALYSQITLHAQFGGVVPELASRDHIQRIIPLLDQVCEQAHCTVSDIDGIAYTLGPGLMGALLVGAVFGRTLAYALNKPALGVHHLEGHLLAPMLDDNPPSYPFICLLVSGGHTQLIDVSAMGCYEIMGESLDDSAGEAFDKVAKMLGLNYPGGPAVAQLAQSGDNTRFRFPRPMTDRPGLDFSFSGIKTFSRNLIEREALNNNLDQQTKANIAAGFELAVADTIRIKCQRVFKVKKYPRLVIAGGVSANQLLRQTLEKMGKKLNIEIYYPKTQYCTDNGAMIAYAGWLRLTQQQQDDLCITPKARWPITELTNKENL